MRRSAVVRLAVGIDAAVVVLPDGGARELPAGSPEELARALASLCEGAVKPRRGRRPVRVEWCLLPPLVDARVVELPRLSPTETTTVLTRHAGRFFPAASEAQVVAWDRVGPRGGPVARVMAAAASEALVASLISALESAGFDPADPVPGHTAWAAAARRARRRMPTSAVSVRMPDRVLALGLRQGRLIDAAAFPPSAGARADERLREMAGGVEPVRVDSPEATAARHAGQASLRLEVRVRAGARLRRERRLARALWAAAAVMVLAAAGVERWGVGRELDAVVSARSAVAAEVGEALAAREALDSLRVTLATLDSLETPIRSDVALLADLAAALPDDAYLSGLSAWDDSLRLDAVAREASPVFEALEGVPGLDGLRPAAPIRREPRPDGATERFSLLAVLTAATAAGAGSP